MDNTQPWLAAPDAGPTYIAPDFELRSFEELQAILTNMALSAPANVPVTAMDNAFYIAATNACTVFKLLGKEHTHIRDGLCNALVADWVDNWKGSGENERILLAITNFAIYRPCPSAMLPPSNIPSLLGDKLPDRNLRCVFSIKDCLEATPESSMVRHNHLIEQTAQKMRDEEKKRNRDEADRIKEERRLEKLRAKESISKQRELTTAAHKEWVAECQTRKSRINDATQAWRIAVQTRDLEYGRLDAICREAKNRVLAEQATPVPEFKG